MTGVPPDWYPDDIMSPRKTSTSSDVAERLQDALKQAQRLGSTLAERLDERFGDEIAVLRTQGKRVLREVRDRSRALNERVQSEERGLPQVVRDTTGQIDALVQRMARVAEALATDESGPAAPSQADTDPASARPAGPRPRRRRKPGGGRHPRRDPAEGSADGQPGRRPRSEP